MIKSSTWISNLSMELSMLKPEEYVQPEWVMKDKEVEVGELPDDLKRIFTLFRFYQKAAAQAAVELQFTPPEGRLEARGKANELHSKADILYGMLWYAATEHFNLWHHPQVALRQGYQVVYSDEPPAHPQGMGFNMFGGQV